MESAGEVQAAEDTGAVRASNAERDVVAGKLQDAFAEGRLDDDEFDQRMRAALTAKTHAELDVLLTDLPAAPVGGGQPPAPGAGPARRPRPRPARSSRGGWRWPTRAWCAGPGGGGCRTATPPSSTRAA